MIRELHADGLADFVLENDETPLFRDRGTTMKCGNCTKPIAEATIAHKPGFRHVLGSYWCYKSGPQHAAPYLIEEQP